MKITEILESQYQTNFKEIKSKADLSNFSQFKALQAKNLPRGNFSVVRPNKSDPHTITKTSKISYEPNKSDMFGRFIKFIYENGYQDNIHMPRVYNWKLITDSDGNKIYKYEVEKLIDGKHIDRDVMARYVKSVIPASELVNYDYMVLSDFVTEEILAPRQIFLTDELNEACRIVAEAMKELGGGVDTHFENLMFRRNKYGIQLVFNDPIA